MTTTGVSLAEFLEPGDQYLLQVALLREEISNATLAIAGNYIEALEECLWRQEVLCTSLKRLLQVIEENGSSRAHAHMLDATADLHGVSLTFAAVIEQSRNHASVMQGLCRSYRDRFPSEPSLQQKHLDSWKA